MSSFPPPAPLGSQVTNGVGDHPLTHETYDPEASECRYCIDILMRVINVINLDPHPTVDIVMNFPEPDLEHEMVAHFHHHDPFELMNSGFHELAGWMANAVKSREIFSSESMLPQDYVDYINSPNDHADAAPVEEFDMDALFDFDEYAADGNAENSGQGGEHVGVSVDAESESISELSEVSDISALNPDHPANQCSSSRVAPKATHQTKDQAQLGQARRSYFAHVLSQANDSDDHFSLIIANSKRRTMKWLEKIE